MRISVIGLGKLGAPLAAVLACKGFAVTGVDVDENAAAAINEGRAPVEEPRLQEMMDGAEGRLSATLDTVGAVSETDITFIIVPTPSEASNGFSLNRVLEVAEAIGEGLRKKDRYHLVVLSSTVMPGDTGDRLLPRLEARSGKVCGRDFGLCYNPYFVALGKVVNDLRRPDFILWESKKEKMWPYSSPTRPISFWFILGP